MDKLKSIKYFFGPMSRNIVDVISKRSDFGIIPSRRQIDSEGGYVEGWNQKDLRERVGKEIVIERDHGGPGQGSFDDDGICSFQKDSESFDIIHIDPWKKVKDMDEGIEETYRGIKACLSVNKEILFEVGTEQAIREFSIEDMKKLSEGLRKKLSKTEYEKIVYFVIQSGVAIDLAERENVGDFNVERLDSMISFCNDMGFLSKEHNGDYLKKTDIDFRFEKGLNAINIAPQIAQIETDSFVSLIEKYSPDDLESLFIACLNSKKWEKWVGEKFDPTKDRKKLISICGHYIFSSPFFISLKTKISNKVGFSVDEKIQKDIEREFSKYE